MWWKLCWTVTVALFSNSQLTLYAFSCMIAVVLTMAVSVLAAAESILHMHVEYLQQGLCMRV
jgi:hypothetical protein